MSRWRKRVRAILWAIDDRSPEKGAYIGAHGISGAVMNPIALKELIPDFIEKGAPLEGQVKKEEVSFLTSTGRFKFPITPPPMNNHGHYVVSLSRLTEWIGKMVEERGVYMFPPSPAPRFFLRGIG